MSDHEFEKQVRQKLDDLRLTPSATAWGRIEQEIRVTRRRRAPLFWIPLLLIGLVAGGYFIAWQDNDKNISSLKGTSPSENAPAIQEGGANSNNISPKNKGDEEKLYTITEEPVQKTEAKKSEKKELRAISKKAKSESLSSNRRLNNTRPGILKSERIEQNFFKYKSEHAPRNVSAEPGKKLVSESGSEIRSMFRLQTDDLYDKLHVEKHEPAKPSSITELVNNAAAPVPPVIVQRKKWSFGFSASAGISGFNNGKLFDLNKALTADFNAQTNARFAPAYTPFSIEPGLSYSAGIVVKRELSQRFHITGGINYMLMSTRYKVGDQVYGRQVVNAAPVRLEYITNYFTLDQHKPKGYKNSYEYVEVPINLQTRIIKSQKLPVYWNTGVSYARLINSNSKQFDGSTGVYYSNEKQLNRSQFAFSTAFDFILFGKRSHPLWIGPQARYNVTKLFNENVSDGDNLLSAGLNIKLFLK